LNFSKISMDRVRALGIINFNIQGSVVSKEAYGRVNVGHNIININKKEKRTKYRALGYSGGNRDNIRRCTRQNNPLLPIAKVITYPCQQSTIYAILTKLEKKTFMPNSVESFRNITEDSSNLLALVKSSTGL